MQMDQNLGAELRRVFAQRLQIARRNAGLTQDQLAETIGRSVDLVSRLERATTGPSLETIALLADALNVSPGSLLGHAPKEEKQAPSDLDDVIDMVLGAAPSDIPKLKRLIAALVGDS